MASTFESWGSVGCEKSSKRVSRPRLSLSRHTNKVPIDSVDSTMKPVSILRMIFAISSVGLLFRDNYVVLVKSGPIRKDNQWVDHVEKLPDQSKDNQSMNNVESKDHQWVNNVTKMPNKSYPLVDYKPLRLKYGPGNPFRALNLVRTKNKLIDKNRLKKPQDQQAPSYQKAVICGCYKCGTTSFYSFPFQQIFDRPPPHRPGDLHFTERNKQWHGAFYNKHIPVKEAKQALSSPDTFSLAIVREPISRLVSAWKNKLACDRKTWGTSAAGQTYLVKKLLKVSGMPLPKHIHKRPKYCLEFPEFVEALRLVHSKGKQDYLDQHFLPQHLYCFRETDPSDWMHIVSTGDPSIGPMFVNLLGLKDTNVTLAKKNSSTKKAVLEISDHDMSILKAITADERAVIEPLLKQ